MDSFLMKGAPFNALQFIPAFQRLDSLSIADINEVMARGFGSQVLIENDLLKVGTGELLKNTWPSQRRMRIQGS